MLAGTQLIYRPPLGFFQTARDGQERSVDRAGILARDGQGVQRLLPRIFAQAQGFQRNGCLQADVAQDLFRVGGLAQQQTLAGRPARDLGSSNLMRYVADLDRLRTVRGGAEVESSMRIGHAAAAAAAHGPALRARSRRFFWPTWIYSGIFRDGSIPEGCGRRVPAPAAT